MDDLDAATGELDAPLAVIDLDALRYNAAELVRRASGRPVRWATKSVRCRALIRYATELTGCSRLMCYSLAEALWLYREGLGDDILVAYPTADRAALRALAADPGAAHAIAITVDAPRHLDLVDAAVGASRPEIRLCLEIDAAWQPLADAPLLGSVLRGNPHIGALRSPVRTEAQARALVEAVLDRGNYRIVGLMAYEGQIAGLGDAPPRRPLRAAAVRWVQRRSAAELAERRAAVVRAVRELVPLEFVNGGGTGSLERTAAEPAVTEVAAGSGLIGPTLFDTYRTFRPRPAALFALPVVRRPGPRVATVFGGGYLASGPAGADRVPTPYLPAGLRLTAAEGAGEVQTPVTGPAADRLRLGDRVWFRHAKAGELAERFSRYHLLEKSAPSGSGTAKTRLVGTVPTYRGEGKSFG
ncbi:alanine racemase [Halopolyspora algeriensis]|uniref:alanine racemase n=1 Tax=Halopolyspora algeriensis TaxID=1500506 RepID=UPI0015CFC482|nr:alanine racemase [Halopolyspora algeriensis]